jgi:hypothetical protein
MAKSKWHGGKDKLAEELEHDNDLVSNAGCAEGDALATGMLLSVQQQQTCTNWHVAGSTPVR